MKGSFPAVLALVALSSSSLAIEDGSTLPSGNATSLDIVPGVFMVEFHDDTQASTSRLYSSLSRDLSFDIEPRLDVSSKLFKGASFRLKNVSDSDATAAASSILADPHVKHVWPVQRIQIPKLEGSFLGVNATQRRSLVTRAEEDAYMPHVMTQVDRLHAEGITGQGLKIGIVDTGIDYNHPALGGCFGEGCLVARGYDLAGDIDSSTVPVPDSDPMDNCHGHGTHVAGIIAAQRNNGYGAVGAAPDATIGMYKITFGCSGMSTDDILVAAFYAAFEDGNDIISCSYGQASGWTSDSVSAAVNRIVEAGVPIAVAAGNTPQAWEVHKPASGRDVTAVGSITNKEMPIIETVGHFSVDGGKEESFVMGPMFLPWENDVSMSLWAASLDTAAEDDACLPLPDDTPDLSNRVALVRLTDLNSGCNPWVQAENIAAKGGKHILFYYRSDSDIAGEERFNLRDVDAASIKASQAKAFIEAISAGKTVTVTISNVYDAEIVVENLPNEKSGGYMSYFTTWGPTWDMEMKPQVSAPGGNIISTYPIAMGSWFVASGTSMAAPLVAAIYALVSQARGTTNPDLLRNAITNTANRVGWAEAGQPTEANLIAPVPQQGAGLIKAYDAARSSVLLSVSRLSFNDSTHIVPEQSFSIHNTGNEDVSFELEHVTAATAETFMELEGVLIPAPFITIVDATAKIAFDRSSVSVPAGSSTNVTVTLTAPTDLNVRKVPIYSGYVLLKATSDGAVSLSLPYLGVAGNLRDIPTLKHDLASANLVDSRGWSVEAGQTFVIPQPGQPPVDDTVETIYPAVFVQSWTIGMPVVRVDLVPASCSDLQNLTCENDFFGVSSLGPFHPPTLSVPRYGTRLDFNGQLRDGKIAPEGTYSFRIGALRMFGDESKEEDWDIVDTPSFVLKYES